MEAYKIAVIDCETDPFRYGEKVEPFVWGYYDGSEFRYFWGDDCSEDLSHFLSDKDLVVYAHNGGKFDFHFLIPWLNRGKITYTNGRILKAYIGDSELRDSYAIIPVPLSAYKKDEFDYLKNKADVREKFKPEILKYLKSDCVNLYEMVTEFVTQFGNKLTIASTALEQMKKLMGGESFARMSRGHDSYFRKYFYGGRCEVFRSGCFSGDYEMWDINSAYPYAMIHEHPSPYSTDFIKCASLPDDISCYFAEIVAISNGALPFREDDGSIRFPKSTEPMTFKATGHEIQAGLEIGTLKILRVLQCYKPRHVRDFSPFIHEFYNRKKRAKKGSLDYLFNKLIQNSGYGKFAIDPTSFKEYNLVWGDRPTGVDIEYSWPEYGVHLVSSSSNSSNYLNVAISASITGFVRAYMHRHIVNCEGVVYCDTDSIACTRFEGNKGGELGQWECEGHFDDMNIGGKKMYAFHKRDSVEYHDYENMEDERSARAYIDRNWKIASKGGILTPNEIIKVAKGGTVTNYRDAPTYSLTNGVRFISRNIKNTARIER